MSKVFIADFKNKVVREKVSMERPVMIANAPKHLEEKIYNEFSAYNKKYHHHINNLTTYPASWLTEDMDGKEMIEGKDFKIEKHERFEYHAGGFYTEEVATPPPSGKESIEGLRQIKFRAWDIGIMFPMAMVGEPSNPSVLTSAGWRECADNVVLMQFTGLKDKAFGKEVYEGDSCTATFKSKGGEVINLTGNIVWDDFMWCLDTFNDVFSLNRVTIIEVIGNIHENPELL